MHTLAKRLHTITPQDVTVTLAGGERLRLGMRSAEFFQEAFQAEAVGSSGATHRIVNDGETAPLVIGRQADDGEWETLGEIVEVDRV